MKVVLDLPKWVDERHIRVKVNEKNDLEIYAGIELAAIRVAGEDHWKVKEGRCNGCGDCCTGLTNHVYPTVDGDCIHLLPLDGNGRRMCAIPIPRSRLCDNDPRVEDYPRCSITYKIVKQK